MELSSDRTVAKTGETESPMKLIEISAGYWLPRALHVVADLQVADVLDDEPRSAAFLADKVGADADSLDRLLRLVASHGVFDRRDDKYVHNVLSRALRADHPQSMRAYVQLVGLPVFWQSWGALEQVVRTGKPAVDDIFGYFKAHPQELETFDAGMRSKAQSAIPPVVAAYDFSVFRAIADIGGGQGHLVEAILRSSEQTRGILFDQPHVIERVKLDESIAHRLSAQGGDFFRGPLPRCDGYLLMEVLHDWTDAHSTQILQQIRQAAPDSAKLLVIETVLPDENAWANGKGNHFGNHIDINMMVLTGGRERTPAEFERLFSASGWSLSRLIPTYSPYSIVEATARS
ncbi:methyltransferase [Occallatibacter savannae]|uniref:methyltransferase n=1 Tax=Occallatibacter savannae TaxID=1002691 RepID=UPI0013A56FEB|nr:methyltransferase [Occallatibacter savannae]